ncbi:MAG TPA: hypothetical protein H9708_00795 [Candidatus Borkfalkia stercoripullorum]|nr:hypothetical protein [Candidatus Borkfalkia stercoripullorum]
MKISAIDTGSNSVRLLVWADGRSLYKKIDTTRLGEGLAATGRLSSAAMERTAEAIARFAEEAREAGSDKLYVFATAAARRAANGGEFVRLVKEKCGLDVDVVSGEEEARLGLSGALGGRAGGIIDVGGASSEVTVSDGNAVVYAKSLDLGAVRVTETCGGDLEKTRALIAEKLPFYGSIPKTEMTAIGGTATSVVALEKELTVYDPAKVHGTVLSAAKINAWAVKLLSMTQEERLALPGMDPRRADVLGGGAMLLAMIAEYAGADTVTVSEADNLEGYIMAREGGRS